MTSIFLDKCWSFVREKPLLFSILYVVVFAALYGQRLTDIESGISLFSQPFSVLSPSAQFLHSSPLIPMFGHVVGISGKSGLLALYGVLIVVCICALYLVTRRLSKGDSSRHVVLLSVLALTPLCHVLFFWIGKSDPALIIFFLLWVFAASPSIQNGALAFMILAHREEALVLLLLQTILTSDYKKLRNNIPGLIVGLGLVSFYFYILGDIQSRTDFVQQNVGTFLNSIITASPAILFALGWFLIIVIDLWIRRAIPRTRLALALGIIFAVTLLTLDNTRTSAVIALPLYIAALQSYASNPPSWFVKFLPYLVILSLIAAEWSNGSILFSDGWLNF